MLYFHLDITWIKLHITYFYVHWNGFETRGIFVCCDVVFMLLYLLHSSLIPPQMGSRCSLSRECCTTQRQEPGAGLTALPSTTLSMLSKWEMISSLRRLRWGRTTAQPRTAEPKQCGEWKRLQENSRCGVMWKNGWKLNGLELESEMFDCCWGATDSLRRVWCLVSCELAASVVPSVSELRNKSHIHHFRYALDWLSLIFLPEYCVIYSVLRWKGST